MRYLKFFLLVFVLWNAADSEAQVRIGSCSSVNNYDKFYITPYVGAGYAKINREDIGKGKMFSYYGGISGLYNAGGFRIGLGFRYQQYNEKYDFQNVAGTNKYSYLKPYFAFELPLVFDDFYDFGLYLNAGADLPLKRTMTNGGFMADAGLYYNWVLTSSSGLYFALDYGFNSLSMNYNSASKSVMINEIKFSIGYRFWF